MLYIYLFIVFVNYKIIIDCPVDAKTLFFRAVVFGFSFIYGTVNEHNPAWWFTGASIEDCTYRSRRKVYSQTCIPTADSTVKFSPRLKIVSALH